MMTISGYHIREHIYESANSLVYRALREADNQSVIIKVLRQEYPLPQERGRYRQEYEMTSMLEVEGVIHAYGLEHIQHAIAIIFEDFGAESLTILRDSGKFLLHAGYLESLPQQVADSKKQVTEQHVLTPEALAVLPVEWLNSLKQGADRADIQLLSSVIEQIREQDAKLAGALAQLVEDFEYDKILAWIQART